MRSFYGVLQAIFLILIPVYGLAQTNEAFNPALKRLDNVATLTGYVDSLVKASNISPNSKQEVMLINNVIQDRFYHGFSHYSAQENLLANLAGKYVKEDLSAVVIPDDILKHGNAACSQQSIVMMEVLKNRGYKVRKLGLVNHFVLEVFHDGAWHFYDPNKEPKIQGVAHDSLPALVQNGKLAQAYGYTPEVLANVFSRMEPGEVNAYPAKNARLFHKITKLFPYFLAAFVLAGVMFLLYFKKKTAKKRLVAN